jgi:hypothetical protein
MWTFTRYPAVARKRTVCNYIPIHNKWVSSEYLAGAREYLAVTRYLDTQAYESGYLARVSSSLPVAA